MSFFKNLKSHYELFDENGIIRFFNKYFLIFNESQFDHCWLLLSDEFSKCLALKGHCKLEIIYGSIEINGIRFSSPFSEILYSPLSNAKIGIRSNGKTVGEKSSRNLRDLLSAMSQRDDCAYVRLESFENNRQMMNAIATNEKWSLLKLSSSGSDAMIDDIVQFKEYKRLFELDFDFPFARKMRFSLTERDGGCEDGGSDRCYFVSEEMRQAIERVVEDSSSTVVSVALVGPKNSGKSSLLRAIINRLLSEKDRCGKSGVCVIDGDPGQSEFCTSGSLSLTIVSRPIFGPPFTHYCRDGDDNNDDERRVEIVEQMFLGDISPNDPKLYCRSIERLYHTYLSINESRETDARMPLLINTMGWLQGLGLVYLAFKLTLIDPTHIIHLKTDKASKDIVDLTPELVANIADKNRFLLPFSRRISSKISQLTFSVRFRSNGFSPVDHRDLKSIAYLFNQTRKLSLVIPSFVSSSEFSACPITRLRCRVPLRVTVVRRAELIDSIPIKSAACVCLMTVFVAQGHNDFSRHLESFYLQWVAICRLDRSQRSSVGHENERELMPCLGMGFVSHVLENINEIDLLTGVCPGRINGCCLVRGRVNPPRNVPGHTTHLPFM